MLLVVMTLNMKVIYKYIINKSLSFKEYLDKIKPYLNDLIDDHKTKGEWKIHSTMTINFMSCKDSNKSRTMHTKSDKMEITIGNEMNEIIEKNFDSFLQRYQKGLEESIKGSEFVANLLYYKLHKISLNRGGSYIESPKWLKNKKATITPKNDGDKCFQYAVAVALNHKQIKNNQERI